MTVIISFVFPSPGPKGNWSSEDWKTGWSVHSGPGSFHPRAHWWQFTAGAHYTLQRDASSWVHPCKHKIFQRLGRTHCLILRLLQTAELVAKLYEAAVKKVPLSEEYHSHLFMAYARVGEYKKMQQVRVRTSIFACKQEQLWLLCITCNLKST